MCMIFVIECQIKNEITVIFNFFYEVIDTKVASVLLHYSAQIQYSCRSWSYVQEK